MFLFSRKLKTPVSTYTDSYRPPCSVRKPIKECVQPLWRENKFVTEGLTVPPVENPSSQSQLEQLRQAAAQAYYRNLTDPTAYRPEKYWLDRSEEKYNPIFIKEDKYATWRTGSYNSAAWNKYSSYLPLLPKETRMETSLHSIPVPCTLRPSYLSRSDREVVNNMLHRVPVYLVMGRGSSQGYYSPCSGRHYCLRGLDYYVDGTSATRRHLYRQGEGAVRSIPCCSYSPRATLRASTHHHQPYSPNSTSPRWNTSHFMKIGGVQRGSYVIHPEFASEAFSAPGRH
ncbi:sperm microtubule inner protein 6 [Pogoniulus pusillus]|uniref:sperm microtubule inner protein 6 n=1 Tax=Pogoniulus pusillus TaxID=488313 RepID=UPI0030B9A957